MNSSKIMTDVMQFSEDNLIWLSSLLMCSWSLGYPHFYFEDWPISVDKGG
jgi:hypothetical protein